MGCFLACFGFSNKRKRRKTLYKVLSRHQHQHHKYANYEVLAVSEKSIIPYSGLRDEGKEQNSVKSKKKKKKKVTFNLNVQIYEPNPTAYQVLDNEEEENKNNTAQPEGRSLPSSILGGEGSAALTMRYPSNYRYYNCSEGYDEEDEISHEESDIDDDEFDDGYDWDDGGSDVSIENDEDEVHDENTKQKVLSEDMIKNQMPVAPNDAEMETNLSGRDRSINMYSVLSPVENLTQWKAIKAKVTSTMHRRKENVPPEQNTSMPLNSSPCNLESNVLQSKPLLPEIAVDSSLSNWLISPNYNVSKITIHCQ
ncbi:nonsense-mediated mRNA decay protein 2 [Gastrolobium bilobum]|uniref:nonsense-mediated mRNA decay protein 2 n=1 Tax=Gastrolobium bilobum TaxID=150636 RepID=UPI002AB1D244|nr:nonsense-mediated mRNA decay protein 2 [Gastrolobium bilobum]